MMNCADSSGPQGFVRKKRSAGGFTLIEMLAVLAVISILVTLMFWLFDPLMKNKERKQARMELAALKLSLAEYHRMGGHYPHCPKELCTPAETLFLSLIGFHNEEGNLQYPPYKSVVNETLLNYDKDWYDPAKVPNRVKASKSQFKSYLMKALRQDLAFVDPWGFPYEYEFPREDEEPGYRLFSVGPDGETGDGKDIDDVE
jgi:prepilin-type N-terminal cleavage/methylation domain-containing protein